MHVHKRTRTFFLGGSTFESRSLLKIALVVEVGKATLKDGTPAVIHRFQFPAICWRGSMSSSSQASYKFRPYIQFTTVESCTTIVSPTIPQMSPKLRAGGGAFHATHALRSHSAKQPRRLHQR